MNTAKTNQIFSLKQAQRFIFCLIFVLLFEILLFPAEVVLAGELQENGKISKEAVVETYFAEESEVITKKIAFENTLPENSDIKVIRTTYRTITAYNSEIEQCDSTPCITANGFDVCKHGIEDTIAANWLKFGTKVRIPELFGDKVFVVRDRMNSRFADRVDVWMLEKETAISFGNRIAKIEILETP